MRVDDRTGAGISSNGLTAVFAGPLVFVVVPLITFVAAGLTAHRSGSLGVDLDAYVLGAQRILDGASPYDIRLLRETLHAGGHGVITPAYPPGTLLAFAPFTVLPHAVGLAAFIVFGLVCLLAVPRVLGSRDVRCSLAMLLSGGALAGVILGSVSPLITLAVAVLWRVRDRDVAAAACVAVLIAAKLLFWPLALWLLLRGRLRAFAIAITVAALLLVASFAPVGMDGAREYATVVRLIAQIQQTDGFSVIAYVHAAGFSVAAGSLVTVLLAGMLAWRAVAAQRRGDELACFTCMLALVLVASPIVWTHYLPILFVPLVLRAPRLDRRWLVIVPLAPVMTSSTIDLPFLLPLVAVFLAGFAVAMRGTPAARSPVSALAEPAA